MTDPHPLTHGHPRPAGDPITMTWRDDPLWVWWLNNTKMSYRAAVSILVIEEGERAAYASEWV